MKINKGVITLARAMHYFKEEMLSLEASYNKAKEKEK